MRAALDRLHRALGRSRLVAHIAARVRNQVQSVIAYHLWESPDPAANGEYQLLNVLAPTCQTFADVGANHGEWTAYLLGRAPTATGTLFEPSPKLCAHLRERFIGKNVEIVQHAVGERVGRVLFIEDALNGQSSAVADTFDSRFPISRRIEVNLTSLDEYFPTHATLDFLKVDTEGYDFKVLLGARRLLASKQIRFIQFEYGSQWIDAGSSLRVATRYLGDHGYAVRLIRSDGLYDLDYARWGDYFRYSNFFAWRPSDLPEVLPLLKGIF